MITDGRPDRPPRHRRQPRLDRRRTSPSTPGWARSSPSASWASRRPRVALLSIGEEKGKGDARIQRATELLDAIGPALRGQRRGQGPDPAPGRRRRLRRGPRQRRDQVLRGPVDVHLRPVARRVRAVAPRAAGVPAHAPGHRPDPRRSSTTRGSAARRCSASRDGDHHPRPGQAADGRRSPARSPRPRPGPASRRSSPRRSAARAAGRAGRGSAGRGGGAAGRRRRDRGRVMNGPELTVGRGVIAELVRLAALRGAGRRARRPRRTGLAPRCSVVRRSRVRIRDDRVVVRLWIVARPGQPLGPLTARSGRPSRRPSSACSASSSGR